MGASLIYHDLLRVEGVVKEAEERGEVKYPAGSIYVYYIGLSRSGKKN